MPKPFRPSAVEKWTRCPTLWLREDVQGWQRPVTAFSPEICMGVAVHAGLAALWKREVDHKYRVLNVFEEMWPKENPFLDRELHEDLALKMVMEAITWCQGFMVDAEPLMIEEALDEDGTTTPDLVTRENRGVVITDWKLHYEVKPEHVHYRLEGPERVHQFQDYIWRVGEKLGEPVRLFRAVHLVCQPKRMIRAVTFVPNPEAQAEWLRQARRKWHLMGMMAADPTLAYRNENGCKLYGEKWPCPQWTACWDLHGDQDLMAQFYTKEEKG